MDERKQELKRLKKACKRAKRKYVTAWKTFGVLFLICTLIFTPLCIGVKVFDNAIAAFFGGTFWELTDEDKNAIYFQSDFETNEQIKQYGKLISKQVEAEGAVLLMNENNALPLAPNAKVSCFSNASDDTADSLKTALEQVGLEANLNSDNMTSDVAIAVLSPEGGEKDLLESLSAMKKAGKIKKIILLINTAQVDFLKGNPYGVDGVLWIGNMSGMHTVAEILAGKVNPSGSLANTYCYDNHLGNFAPITYGGYDGKNIPDHASTYTIYQEGIYVGYKYYETRYEDYVMGTGNAGNYGYSNAVAYPFGFGLSYTTFRYSDMAVMYNEKTDRFEVTVTVTNTGTMAGKETVQVYAQAPYTDYDKANGVEKASVNLVGFGKTKVIAPGSSETVTVQVDKRDLASYDAYGAKTYILDAGSYYLTVATDAHNAVNNILSAKGFAKETTENRMDTDGDVALTYKWEQAEFDDKTYATAQNGTPITNQLSNVDPNLYEGVKEEVKWLSRRDWEGTFPQEPVVLQLTQTLIAHLQDGQYDPEDYPEREMPTLGAVNGLKLYDMIGLAFDDPKWQTLLDQLTFDEMVALIGDAFYWRMPVESVQAPGARYENSPVFTSEDVMVTTFNTELLYEVGKVIGNNCLASDVSCLYGPGVNDSEDGFLTGKIYAAEVLGIQDKGVDVVMKNFAGQAVWLNEQAAREQYLRVFQYAFLEGKANGVMMGLTRLGATWSGGHKGLMTNIMQKEWGSNGMFVADNVSAAYVTGADGVLAGVTAYKTMVPYVVKELEKYENDPVIVSAMRQACHRNLYALANSSGMNGVGENTTVQVLELRLVIACQIAAAVSMALFVFFTIMWGRGKKKWKKTEAYLDYRTLKTTLQAEKKAK